MKSLPEDEYDEEHKARLEPEPWMLEQLRLNRHYVHWDLGADYMKGPKDNGGWDAGLEIESWKAHDIEPGDLNEVVHFYFEIEREAFQCAVCKEGFTLEAFALRCDEPIPTFYVPDDDELIELSKHYRVGKPGMSLEELRKLVPEKGVMIDSINTHIILEQRCRARGITYACPECDGRGDIFVPDHKAYLSLVYWLLHPRKGATRGVRVKHIQQVDLPAVYAFLTKAAKRNAERFEAVVAAHERTHGELDVQHGTRELPAAEGEDQLRG